jgi:enoyl-CoA hydratase/carnithine racemase
VGADEALRLRLVDHVVAPDELLAFCRRYVENIAATCSPTSLAVIKRQVYQQLHAGLGAAERDSVELMVASFGRPDFAEGVASFLEKRPPRFARVGSV